MRVLLVTAVVCGALLFGQIAGLDSLVSEEISDSTMLAMDDTTAVFTDSLAVTDTLAVLTEDSVGTDSSVVQATLIAEETTTEPAGDTVVIADSAPEETLIPPAEVVPDNVPELASKPFESLPMGLSYGYKGFQWGSLPGVIPRLSAEDSIIYYDASVVKLKAKLGLDDVIMAYHFADSGFWKIEIDFDLIDPDIDHHVDLFLRVEKGMTEIYGPPVKTNQIFSGPSPSYYSSLDVNFSRAFYRSSWTTIPVRIELLLNTAVQQSGYALPIFSGSTGAMKLVYYNPDFMFFTPLSDRLEPVPSIFDLY